MGHVLPQEDARAIATAIAQSIVDGFDEYRTKFEQISAGAQRRFEQADWLGMQKACTDRVDLYDLSVSLVTAQVKKEAGNYSLSTEVWRQAKLAYTELIISRTHGELAETFFNSIYCRTFRHKEIDDTKIFVKTSLPKGWEPPKTGIINHYSLNGNLPKLISQILDDYAFNIPYENKRRDVRNIVRHLRDNPHFGMPMNSGARLEIIKTVFFRNKGAYIVGRSLSGDGSQSNPFVLPILNNEQGGVYVDTLILDPDDVSVIFSFTRSYFMVIAPIPFEYVRFLSSLLPTKKVYELYSSFGFYKHGKTEFYRDFLDHLDQTDDQFVIAPGIKGMVMTVFTLPSLDSVFKIIKDRFHPSKDMTRETVKAKYRLVKRHDKAGRMADTQEFSNFIFERSRFSDELLEELLKVAADTVEVTEDKVIVKHLWVERRMTPLNIYIDNADEEELRSAISEYGNAIRQLASANIFPGDMLFKNFGVTRHGRVVFYDYDEICYLTECNFRRIPEAQTIEQEMASEPWYSISPADVFPEEFIIFLAGRRRREVAAVFNELHYDIFDADYWQGLQNAINHGEVMDVFPYRRKKRFSRK
ncbi:bifunctional isocitrate dehydrogenase kinase/phosphatase [Motiliproteus sp. MSK22-1]|uniref:bifunctional isocitrate dehydrogenase kinase/phosphatase n=1 Tax=Motiliproteus sp. MSK22-1 TaxID=1897630 RepID=UPI0009773AF9|nr:bifunctional isocitrate dehydrogenase kinase/phosphatase [Motiliproteus sp. MSK22-1]OMH33691.1 bifunctional isocitrate dehydrogenase kinase/phosphatase [Motiliproteus sp. MSK22-1]